MRHARALPAAMLLALQSSVGHTQPAAPPTAIEVPTPVAESIRTALKQRIPALAVLQIHSTPLPEVYEIVSPDGIAYTDVRADYVLKGELIDTRTRRNLTEERWVAFNHVDFATLPLALAIKSKRGSGAREIAVFADPQCPYCQELEARLAQIDDITVYTFLYPLDDLHPGATARAHQIWCASDRPGAWNNWMRKHEPPEARECNSDPIRELAALGERLHIERTPTIIFRSGFRSAGLPSAKQFEQLLEKESGPATADAAATARPAS